MLAAPTVTVLARKLGIQLPMLIGAAMLSGGFISASFASHIWHLYLSQGALVGLGVGFIYVPSMAILPQWFVRSRSLANGISAAGSGIGGLIFSLATGAMIENIGLEWSLRIIGILTGIANTTAAAFIRDRNAIVRPPQLAFDTKLLCRFDVLLLLSWAFISMLGYITLLFSLSDYALSIGLSRAQATQITAFLNLGTACGRPFIGVASDRLGRIEIAGVLTLVCGLCCLVIWLPSASFGVTVFFALISGAILGVFWVVSAIPNFSVRHITLTLCCPRQSGPFVQKLPGSRRCPHYFRSRGWPSFFQLLVRISIEIEAATSDHLYIVSEVIALQLRRPGKQREYLYPQIFCGLSYTCASFCLWQLRRVRMRKLLPP
jgi:MFS family permease